MWKLTRKDEVTKPGLEEEPDTLHAGGAVAEDMSEPSGDIEGADAEDEVTKPGLEEEPDTLHAGGAAAEDMSEPSGDIEGADDDSDDIDIVLSVEADEPFEPLEGVAKLGGVKGPRSEGSSFALGMIAILLACCFGLAFGLITWGSADSGASTHESSEHDAVDDGTAVGDKPATGVEPSAGEPSAGTRKAGHGEDTGPCH